jgi:hypothetical protein
MLNVIMLIVMAPCSTPLQLISFYFRTLFAVTGGLSLPPWSRTREGSTFVERSVITSLSIRILIIFMLNIVILSITTLRAELLPA